MKTTRLLWDMPITVDIVDSQATTSTVQKIFHYFEHIDAVFSPFIKDSELSRINQGSLSKDEYSPEMSEVLSLCEQTSKETNGYFNIHHNDRLNPLGLVKGWAVNKASRELQANGFTNFFIDAGGDVEVIGKNGIGKAWTVGIRNPYNRNENVKIIQLENRGIATSGTAIRGQHIYNPYSRQPITEIVSLTVIGPNVYEADRFATAAFAMGKDGINFIASKPELDGYMIDTKGIATFTPGFNNFVSPI